MAKSKKAPKKSAKPAKKSAKPAKKSASKKPQPKIKSKPAAKSAKPAPKTTPKKLNGAITPLEDRLIVTVEGPSETTAGGIIIPGTVSERPSRGTVMASGRGRRGKKGNLRPLDVEVGDTVMFGEYSGTKIEIDGQELLILREEEVLGIVT